MEYSVMEQYWIWLSSVEGIGPRRFYQLLSVFKDARDVWENVEDPRMRIVGPKAWANVRAAQDEYYFYQLFANLERKDIRAITRLSADYPPRLARIVDPPPTIFVKGEINLNPDRAIAVVGSRRCTRDGERTAFEFSDQLSREGVTVISGMAMGIDTAAHKGALKADGTTIAVLGSGADVIYPEENERLYNEILDKGGAIVSEYLPGMPPLAQNFPARNRIISGMSDALLMVEGAKRSGAMITVNLALEEGKPVFAVPGSIYAPLSAAPNRLIAEGACPALSAWDIVEYMNWGARPEKDTQSKSAPELSEDETNVVIPLREQSLTVSELVAITGFSSQKIISLLTMLELRGIICKQPGGEYRAYK